MTLFESEDRSAITTEPAPDWTATAAPAPHPPEADDAVEMPTERGFLPVFRNQRFLILWGGQVFSQLADKIYLVLVIALIASDYQAAGDKIGPWVAAVMIAFTIPAVLFGSLAGVYVDRWAKKELLVLTNLLRGGLVLSLPPLLWLPQSQGRLWDVPAGFLALLAVTFFISTLTQFFAPAEQAAIPLVVARRHLLAANSLYTTTSMALLIVGFAVGEPLLAIADRWVMQFGFAADIGKELLVGGSYALAGLLLLVLKTGETQAARSPSESHPLQDIADGIRYLNQHRRVRNALIQLTILFSVFAALAVLAVPLAASIPGLKAEQFGFLLAAAGVGLGLGAAIVGHWGNHGSRARWSLWGSAGSAAMLVALALLGDRLWLALLITAGLGGFAALIGVPMQTTIQAETPEAMRGKVFGLQNNAVNIALSLPLALAGVAETIWGLQPVLLALASLFVAGGLLTWYISRTGTSAAATSRR
ncbi:MAG: MFS transporter [Spirulinaceae cyanobacterium SM2_1_0]|nr:MFS transporter [Spirulinaceae cyanobacterium SM2_1_0]